MLKGKIEFEGKTYSDVEVAIDEAKKKIQQTIKSKGSGITSGFDGNDDGNYSFEIGDKKLFRKDLVETKEGKDEGWIKELADETELIREWIEREDIPFRSLRLVHAIPTLVTAVTNLVKRVSELEKLEETRELVKRGG